MGKYFLGIATVLIIIGVAAGSLWVCDRVGVIKLQDLVLNQVGRILGTKDLAATYELGKKHSEVLQEKEEELVNKEKQLAVRETKLQTDFTELQDQKQLWLKERSQTVTGETPEGKAKPKPVATLDPDIKSYLATLAAMKAPQAAKIIQNLPDETVFLILKQLRKQQATKLMENLPPDYLTRITKARLGQTPEQNNLK